MDARAIGEFVLGEVQRAKRRARAEGFEGGGYCQAIAGRDEGRQGGVVAETLKVHERVVADVEGGERAEASGTVERVERVLGHVEAPELGEVEQTVELVDGVTLEVQRLQAHVLLEIGHLGDTLAVQVEHVV